jgi:hypothetical protein
MMAPDEIRAAVRESREASETEADREAAHQMQLLTGCRRVADLGAVRDGKRFQTLRAECALIPHMRGTVLHQLEDDAGRPVWIVTWQALTRSFGSLDEVSSWLAVVEGRAP